MYICIYIYIYITTLTFEILYFGVFIPNLPLVLYTYQPIWLLSRFAILEFVCIHGIPYKLWVYMYFTTCTTYVLMGQATTCFAVHASFCLTQLTTWPCWSILPMPPLWSSGLRMLSSSLRKQSVPCGWNFNFDYRHLFYHI